MFGISSTEFLIILVIALVVIGPQKLPEMIRTVGKWVGKIQHFTRNIKNDLSNEFELDEIKKSLEELKQSSELQKLKSELESAKSGVEKTISNLESQVEETKSQVESEVKKADAYLEIDPALDPKMPASLNSEEAFDLAFEESIEDFEAEFGGDHEEFGADEDHAPIMRSAPEGYHQKVARDTNVEDRFVKIVRLRQAEIAAQSDQHVATQFALLEARRTRALLSPDELKRRVVLRQAELNR